MKLSIELVPKTCWGKNLRTQIKKSDWDKIRKAIYANQNMHCNICDDECTVLDAHEIWEFDEITHVQKLLNIIGICKPCHGTIHFGRAQIIGYEKEAIEQFFKVNDCDLMDLEIEKLNASAVYARRNKIIDWKLDLSFIENQGYTVNK